MWHGVKKIKIEQGSDANKMLVRKLAINFFKHGKLVTTVKKAKVLKSTIEKLVERTKSQSEANKNVLLGVLDNWRFVQSVFKNVGPALKDKVGGYVRIVRLGSRQSDGAVMSRLEWAYPVVFEEKKETPKTPEKTKKVKVSAKKNKV